MDSPGEEVFLTGNEAIARGALEASVRVVASYPGGPVTQILENLAKVLKEFNVYAEWSTNEKVALEVGVGASLAGQRALVSFKDVGLNSSFDTFMALSRCGLRAGLVLVVGQDGLTSPDMQDCRFGVEMAHNLALDPSDPREARDMTVDAFELSERLEMPVILMPNSTVCYMEGPLKLGTLPKTLRDPSFQFEPSPKYISCGPTVLDRLDFLHSRWRDMVRLADESPFNDLVLQSSELGLVVTGNMYHTVLKSLRSLGLEEKISLLKVGTTNPPPASKMKRLLASKRKVLVIEELEPYLEKQVRSISAEVDDCAKIRGKLTGDVPEVGLRRLTSDVVAHVIEAWINIRPEKAWQAREPEAPTGLCSGCLHRAALYAARCASQAVAGKTCIITGDQGCSLLLSFGRQKWIHTEYHMGSSIGIAHGLVKAGLKAPVIAAIGDSAFYHTGLPALINAVWNSAPLVVLVLDNMVTAMTGMNPNPGTGETADGGKARITRIEDLAKGCGVEFIRVVDPSSLRETMEALRGALEFGRPAVVVARGPCMKKEVERLKLAGKGKMPSRVVTSLCSYPSCKVCILDYGCPSLSVGEDRVSIDPLSCAGCRVCVQICPRGAIALPHEDAERLEG